MLLAFIRLFLLVERFVNLLHLSYYMMLKCSFYDISLNRISYELILLLSPNIKFTISVYKYNYWLELLMINNLKTIFMQTDHPAALNSYYLTNETLGSITAGYVNTPLTTHGITCTNTIAESPWWCGT